MHVVDLSKNTLDRCRVLGIRYALLPSTSEFAD